MENHTNISPNISPNIKHDHKQHHDHDHDHNHEEINFEETPTQFTLKDFTPAIITGVLMLAGILMDYFKVEFFTGFLRLAWYLVAYAYVGLGVLRSAINAIKNGNVFSEFFLMSIATLGAFLIGEYSEGVAVMLFYHVGELFQDAATNRAKTSIQALLDVRPKTATVIRNKEYVEVDPSTIKVGETIRVKVGEKVALDGILITNESSFDTAALTGESKPDTKRKNELILAGMINLSKVADIQVTSEYADTKLSQILAMVQDATSRKSKTQLFITRFARIYTPIVVLLAVLITFIPYLFLQADYIFQDWLYRGLVFLVISCPCALVISVPLGYFGGIGLASKNGILFKGGNYLDALTKVDTVVMDKTGTLTKGVFEVQTITPFGITAEELLQYTAAIEKHSSHPIATAITMHTEANYTQAYTDITDIEEIAGHGLKGSVNGRTVLAGNAKLLEKYQITYPTAIHDITESIVVVAIDNKYAGHIVVADEIKEDAKKAINELHELGIQTVMLSGDKTSITEKVAKQLGIDIAFGDLLPADKVSHVEKLKKEGRKIAFTGDGINDAPVLALSDVGIAMGGLGSDAAIETADVIIQNDKPSRIPLGIKISKKTRQIVQQNIALAIGVKVIVLILGAFAITNLWMAIFADVGVSLIAILNAVRIQHTKIQ